MVFNDILARYLARYYLPTIKPSISGLNSLFVNLKPSCRSIFFPIIIKNTKF